MKHAVVSATDAARGFGELLARVRYRRESFLIRRGRTIVARLVPVEVPAISGADAASAWKSNPRLGRREAERLFDDLEAAREDVSKPPESPWQR
jgi:antitoxin (DNA-binding transcriptional repressor) of toxin-antitoxin stability system